MAHRAQASLEKWYMMREVRINASEMQPTGKRAIAMYTLAQSGMTYINP